MKIKKFVPVILTSVFVSLHFGALLYITSAFLAEFFSPLGVSVLFVLGALGNIVFFFLAPQLLRKVGKKLLLVFFLSASALSSLGMAFSHTRVEAASYFLIYGSVFFLVYYCLDLFLEELSSDRRTGEIRGFYASLFNAGIMGGPLFSTFLSAEDSLEMVYVIGALLLVIPLIFSIFIIKSHKSSRHGNVPLFLPFRAWWKQRDIRAVTLAKLSLEIFFSFMVVYTPIYLHDILAFGWAELGVIFTVMLIPFVILEWPIGELSDRLWGEKEIMSIGFFIIGLAVLVMPFIDKSFWGWMFILFFSRVGASLVEITTDIYFFKKISANDDELLSIFRLMRPLSMGLAAGAGAILLSHFSFVSIFFVTAIVVFIGMREALYLKDTR